MATQLRPFLTDIANAIRVKKGTSGVINAQNFASEIGSIGGGIAELTEVPNVIDENSPDKIVVGGFLYEKYVGGVSGTWYFYVDVNTTTGLGTYNINFTSNGENFVKLSLNYRGYTPIYYYKEDGTEVKAYDNSNWTKDAYRTITITGGADVENSSLLSFLNVAAQKQSNIYIYKKVVVDTPLNIDANGVYTTPEKIRYTPISVNVPNALQSFVDARGAIYLCYNYKGTNVDFLNGIDFSNVINAYCMFQGCTNLTYIPALNIKAGNSNNMFKDCSNLKQIDVFGVAQNASSSFVENCYSLTKIILRAPGTIITMSQEPWKISTCYHFTGTVNATYNPNGLKDGKIYVPDNLVEEIKTKWSNYAEFIVPLSTLEE